MEKAPAVMLCRLEDIADGGSAAFDDPTAGDVGDEAPHGLMALRQAERVFVYVNSCPHVGLPLDFKPGRFLNREKTHILCTNHGALFRVDDGHCIEGPCAGKNLKPVPAEVRDGGVYLCRHLSAP